MDAGCAAAAAVRVVGPVPVRIEEGTQHSARLWHHTRTVFAPSDNPLWRQCARLFKGRNPNIPRRPAARRQWESDDQPCDQRLGQ